MCAIVDASVAFRSVRQKADFSRSGWMDFRFADLVTSAGRPLCSALRLLLSEQRLLALPREQRLAALLESSRKYQNEVSERLSEQVLHALYELLRGVQVAHDTSGGELLGDLLSAEGDRNDIYRGLLTVILRLVFLLYAEERGMLPEDETFVRHYSLSGLYQRLREDAALNPDTMDQRFGAWAQLLLLRSPTYSSSATWSWPRFAREPSQRCESRRSAYQEAILTGEAWRHAVQMVERRSAEVPFAPFHWEIEFPDVFDRDNPDFDAFVGNPPFAGKNSVAAGFTFDDTDKKGVASSLADMQRLIDSDPRNREVIFPYIGGEEINTSPTHAHHRYVINFGERSEAKCRQHWPDLLSIVEDRVKPERTKVTREVRRRRMVAIWR